MGVAENNLGSRPAESFLGTAESFFVYYLPWQLADWAAISPLSMQRANVLSQSYDTMYINFVFVFSIFLKWLFLLFLYEIGRQKKDKNENKTWPQFILGVYEIYQHYLATKIYILDKKIWS